MILNLINLIVSTYSMAQITQNQTCDQCNRTAKYTYPVAGCEDAVKCGYHTWWFGTQGDPEYHQRLRTEYEVEN